MPIEYGETPKIHHEMISFTCDCCAKKYDGVLDMQEMLYFHNNCGYGSVFGDGNSIELVMCESCVKEELGDYIRWNVIDVPS